MPDPVPTWTCSDTLACGLWLLTHQAAYDPGAAAVIAELRRLYAKAGEPLPAALAEPEEQPA